MLGSRLLWAIVLGFLLGVLSRSFFSFGVAYVLFLLTLAATFVACGIMYREKLLPLVIVAVMLISCAGGIVRMSLAALSGDPRLTSLLNKHIVLMGAVSAEPDVRDAGIYVPLHVYALLSGSTSSPVDARILVSVSPHTPVAYGDEVIVSGMLSLPAPFDTGLGRQFDYQDYLGVSGITYVMSFVQMHQTGKNESNILRRSAIAIKQIYLRGESAVLPEPEAGLAGGITVGDKRSIGPELSADFQKVNLMQMVVLSGYNITVVANAAARLFATLSRYIQGLAGVFIVCIFIAISGGASSAVRAGMMAVLAIYARASKRTYNALRALAIVAFAMILWNPFLLAFDPGFQLSCLAMLGLTLFTTPIARYIAWIPERFALREIFASTLATQITVLPLLLYQDGQLSILALPANVLAMMPIPFAMLASCIAALCGIVFGSLATPVAYPAYMILSYVISVAHTLASLPFASITIAVFGVEWMAGAYVILFGIAYLFHRRYETD